MIKASFIATGSELLDFKINKYSPIFSQKFFPLGIKLNYEITTRDNPENIKKSIEFALKNSDLIIICGGLGPTFDDYTRKAVSEIIKRKLFYSKEIEQFFKNKYGKITWNLKNQCYVIKNAILIENNNGTAFGEIIEYAEKLIVLLPGPLREWGPMWNKVERHIKLKFKIKNELLVKRYKIADVRESELQNTLKNIIKNRKFEYTILAGPNICEFVVRGNIKDINKFKELDLKIHKILGNKIYGYDNDKLEEVVGKFLRRKNKTVSTAESCTGGLVANLITDIPGSSEYFKGGINAYSNEIKNRLLKVKKNTLVKYGAVSKQCAREMAENVRKIFGTDFGISVTGIAGPQGATPKKPVGLVYFGISSAKKTVVVKRIFKGERTFIKQSSANMILHMLYKMVK